MIKSIDEFREIAPKKFSWLEEKGFRRAKEFEKTTSTLATLVYCGENLAFEFSLDVRDQCIDAEVIKVECGKLLRNSDGGYSSDIYDHLVKNEGYRGSPKGNLSNSPKSRDLEGDIDGWISLLDSAGSTLLDDRDGALG